MAEAAKSLKMKKLMPAPLSNTFEQSLTNNSIPETIFTENNNNNQDDDNKERNVTLTPIPATPQRLKQMPELHKKRREMLKKFLPIHALRQFIDVPTEAELIHFQKVLNEPMERVQQTNTVQPASLPIEIHATSQ